MKIEIFNRLSGKAQFVAEITDSGCMWKNIGLAVKWAVKTRTNLRGANLIYADLTGADLTGANFSGAYLTGADFISANLRYADFSESDLRYANLRNADFRGAILPHLDITPVIEDIHQAVYAAASSKGALDMSTWHSDCGTAHCWAGWVVTLAGEQGKALEEKTDTSVAAALILMKSDPDLEKMPSWFSTNGEALAEMKKLAGIE